MKAIFWSVAVGVFFGGALSAPAIAQSQTPIPLVDDRNAFYSVEPADIECVLEAAYRQGVAANVLLAIASVENGKNGQVVENTNGTYDIGHFQINTMHWEEGGMFHGVPQVSKEDVAWRGCYNAELAAWMLKRNLDENNGKDYWTKAASYHSRTPRFNAIYREKLIRFSVHWAAWLETHFKDKLTVSER